MLKLATRLLFPGCLLLLVGAYRVGFPPAGGAESRLGELPFELLGLPGQDVPVQQAIVENLEPDDMVIRRYQRPDGAPLWVVMIYFVNARRGGHDPETCYRSQGYRIENLPDLVLESDSRRITADQFRAIRPERTERVAVFWYSPGQGSMGNVDQYRKDLFLQGLRHNVSYGIFVRVSTLESGAQAEAEQWNNRFVERVADELPRLIRS